MSLDLVPLRPSDAAAIHDLTRRWETYWSIPAVTSIEETEEIFGEPGFNPDLDTAGVWLDGRLVAMGSVHHTPSGVRQEKTYIPGRVDPEMRGNGIGRRLLAWQIERSSDILRSTDPTLPRFVRAYEWESVDEAHRLYRRLGMTQVRWFEDMVRPVQPPIDAQPPPDVKLVPWHAADSEQVRAVANAAFADHWASTPRDRETWEFDLGMAMTRLDLSVVALADTGVVGYSHNGHIAGDEAVTGRRDGWILSLGVVRDRRRQGIAAALIARSIELFREVGFTHAILGVDSDNPTGAAGLYTRLGFETLHRQIASELQVPAPT